MTRRQGSRGPKGHDLESVLAAAVEVFNERGYDGTSMDNLARRLGISKSSIYHHVRGKEALLRLAVDRALDGLFDVAAAAERLDATASERLEYCVRNSILLLQNRLPYVTLLLRIRGNTDTEREAMKRRREFDHYVAGLVKQAAADGDVRPDVDPDLAARLLFGMVNSMVEWYRPTAGGVPGEVADTIRAVAFEGLRVRRPPPDR